MKNSAIVLAGGFSRRFGQPKALVELTGRPLLLHILDRISGVTDETVVVASSPDQRRTFARLLNPEVKVVVDEQGPKSPLVGALTGFQNAGGEHSLLLPCDTPFVSKEIASLLLDLCLQRDAVIPRWPNGYVEPLQAAYKTKLALTAAKTALEHGELDLRSMIVRLRKLRYVSTEVLRKIDPKLMTFFNVNTPEDLKKAGSMLKRAKLG